MGVKGLKAFMTTHYLDSLEYQPLKGYLVIDGYGIMYDLYQKYKLDVRVGGRYPIFKQKVVGFFKSFVESGLTSVVVVDGLELDDTKFDTLCGRKLQRIKAVQEGLKDEGTLVTPIFLHAVFLEAVREAGCELIFADGEADPVIMKTANCYNCPVLANDTDFFIFPLKKGFILHEENLFRYNWISKQYEAKIFKQEGFVRRWLVSGHGGEPSNELCLLIPALVGNDFLQPAMGVKTVERWMPRVGDCYKCHRPTLRSARLSAVTIVHTAVNYIQNQGVRSVDQFQGIVNNIQECRRIYSFGRKATYDATIIAKVPQWILKLHRDGLLSPYITQALISSKVFVTVPAESPYEKTSSTLSSREIRRLIYDLLQVPEVTEFFPSNGDLAFQKVRQAGKLSPQSTKDVSYFLVEVLGLDGATSNLIQQNGFLHVEDWFLVAASLVYWAKVKRRSQMHAKALILTMMDCFHGDTTLHLQPLPHAATEEWLFALHTFSEWQCIYHDLCVLNTLVGSPLHRISPCNLYDGHIAILYSLQSDHARNAWDRHAAKSVSMLKYFTSLLALESESGYLPWGVTHDHVHAVPQGVWSPQCELSLVQRFLKWKTKNRGHQPEEDIDHELEEDELEALEHAQLELVPTIYNQRLRKTTRESALGIEADQPII